MKPINWKPQMDQMLTALVKARCSHRKAAEMMELSRGAVQRRAKKLGLTFCGYKPHDRRALLGRSG